MFGILLAITASLFSEASSSIGKFEIKAKKESLLLMGFLAYFWAALWFLIIALSRDNLHFSFESLPTLGIRVVLEIILTHIAIQAIVEAERSTFSFLRVLTLPLLLIVDIFLGYSISTKSFIGILLIVSSLLIASFFGGLHKKGVGKVVLSAILAVATVSLYKYDITHWNSVEVEQLIVLIVLISYFAVSLWRKGERPHRYLFKYPFSIQAATAGLATLMGSFAYLFAPASIIMSAERSSGILMAILTGNLYFKERHLLLKLTTFIILTFGIILLA